MFNDYVIKHMPIDVSFIKTYKLLRSTYHKVIIMKYVWLFKTNINTEFKGDKKAPKNSRMLF